ncbi:MAG: DUF502 domain-containing protein [Candidatus Tectomicrobia bacterium]|nr:DUF502 domain-containing protein [Candidatus Tectomicrobia bacterium]
MLKALRYHFRTVIIAGLLVVIPIWITFMLLQFLAVRLDGVLGPHISRIFRFLGYQAKDIPGVGIVVMVVAIYFVGLFARNFFGRQIFSLADRILGKVPFVRTVYVASKQLLETIALQQKNGFKRCVLIEYPRPGIYALGFVTSEAKGEIQAQTRETVINVFVPTTPNPTSGLLIFVPREQIIPLEMSIEDGIKYVVAGGLIVPPYKPRPGPPGPVLSNVGKPPGLPAAPDEEKQRASDGKNPSSGQ